MWISSGPVSVIKGRVGTGGVTAGALCVVSSNTIVIAAEAVTAATVYGIAAETAIEGADANFYKITSGTTLGARKTAASVLTGADVTKTFDIASGAITIDTTDVTAGPFVCTEYDNATDTIYGNLLETMFYA